MKQAPHPPQTPRRLVLLLAALSCGSGCAALLYQLVWFQLLEFVIGSSAVSLAVLLGTFMAGLCIGNLLLPRIVPPARHPLRVYALLEAGIGLLGAAVLVGMPLVSRVYSTTVGRGFPGLLLRGGVAAVCLLPPTVLMGATLPAMGRWLKANAVGASQLGVLYSTNTVGAVIGCLLAGFYLLRMYDLAIATWVAVTTNATLALAGFVAAFSYARGAPPSLARGAAGTPPVAESAAAAAAPPWRAEWAVYLAIGLSGASALAAEVAWTRLLSLLLGPTVYSFSIILACLLSGLGIGSAAGAYLARRARRPRLALGACQLLLMAAVAWAGYMLFDFFPQQIYRPPADLASQLQADIALSLMTMLPAALLWGASFPLALAAAAGREPDPGRLVGRIYAANTVGAVIGAVATSLVLLSSLGSQNVHRLLVASSGAAALVMFAASPASQEPHGGSPARPGVPSRAPWWRIPLAMGTVVASALLMMQIDEVPGLLIAFGPYAANAIGRTEVLYGREGLNTSVAVTEGEGIRSFHVSGKVEASNAPPDMQHLRMLGHIPALVHPRPQSVLVVGCGAGVTAGSFVPYSSVERVVVVEIEPLVPRVASRFFSKENGHVIDDRRVTIVNDDGRHYVLTTPEQFDIVTSDPIHPWVKGSASLYTQEYFELVKRHLKPGGIVSQWVPLYESSVDVVKSEIATFFAVFPQGTVWGTRGGDLVLVGQATPSPRINVDAAVDRVNQSDAVAASLREVGFSSAVDLLATYSGRAPELGPWLAGADINRDRSLRLQYRAGLHVEFDDPEAIYASMISGRTYPDDLFAASDGVKQALEHALSASGSDIPAAR